ncbi:MAG TPA: serine/threonine-protein kinase [Planctomycetota bacterium]|nr:serine/threonine-protein kinase [Planctomycetota bacterium]
MAHLGVTAICVCGARIEGTPSPDGTVTCGACRRQVVVDSRAAARAFGTADATRSVEASPLHDSTGKPFKLEMNELTQSVADETSTSPRLPEKLGPYRVLGRLGAGGMGVVYRGHDETLDRAVALKVLARTRGNESEQSQLEREARAVAAVTHQNVVQVYAAGEQDGLAYFAMELVNGPDLREVLDKEGPLAPGRARRYMTQAAAGLRAAARKNILHRDVKPANLLLDKRDDQIKVADFGLAKRACVDASMGGTSLIAGTPLYVAPEVIKNGEGDHRADLYSLGATFFHLLAGAPPFGGKTAADALVGHMNEPAPDLRSLRPDVPQDLAAAIRRCLEKDPAARFASYDDLLAAIDPGRAPSSEIPALPQVHVLPRPAPQPAPQAIPVALPPRRLPQLPPRARGARWPYIIAFVAIAGGFNALHTRSSVLPSGPVSIPEPLAACEFSDLVGDLLHAGPIGGELLAPIKVSDTVRISRRDFPFVTTVEDTCEASHLPYAICGTRSPVLAWHVHDVRSRTVLYAKPDGSVQATDLYQFLRYLRGIATDRHHRDTSWRHVVRGLAPFLPDDADRELRRLEASD